MVTLHIYGDANFMKIRFCLQHCHAPLRMLEVWPALLCHML